MDELVEYVLKGAEVPGLCRTKEGEQKARFKPVIMPLALTYYSLSDVDQINLGLFINYF